MPWQTPDGLPTKRRYKRLRIPVIESPEPENRYVYGSVLGALYELTLAENWQANGVVTPEEIALIFYSVFQEFLMDIPVGSIMIWLTNSPPADWLICDGQAIDRAIYSDLFALFGTQFGAGNGTTTFNLPDLRARFPVGRKSDNTRFDTIGETGGQESQDHTHTLDLGPAVPNRAMSTTQYPLWQTTTPPVTAGFSGGAGSTTFYGMVRTMDSQIIDTLPPFVVVNFIIHALAS